MVRKRLWSALAALICMASGCAKKAVGVSESRAVAMMPIALASSPRFVAEHDKLEIFTPEGQLQKSWESAIAFCGTIQCEVISSSITMRTGDALPSGSISMRVVPEDLKKLFAHAEHLGKIVQHTTERIDKTTEVIDAEAKIKNLTSFRDNLRTMLGKRSATVQDLVEIQKQLTDTQSELDSEAAQRKILANETEKVAVELSFRVERLGSNTGLSQIWSALRESGDVLADSTSSLITTIVAVIPWLILIVPAVWILAKAWKRLKFRRNRAATTPTTPAAT